MIVDSNKEKKGRRERGEEMDNYDRLSLDMYKQSE